MAATINGLEHGGKVGMVFEMYKNCGKFFKLLEETIKAKVEEKHFERRQNGELFEMKIALMLGTSVSKLSLMSDWGNCRRWIHQQTVLSYNVYSFDFIIFFVKWMKHHMLSFFFAQLYHVETGKGRFSFKVMFIFMKKKMEYSMQRLVSYTNLGLFKIYFC